MGHGHDDPKAPDHAFCLLCLWRAPCAMAPCCLGLVITARQVFLVFAGDGFSAARWPKDKFTALRARLHGAPPWRPAGQRQQLGAGLAVPGRGACPAAARHLWGPRWGRGRLGLSSCYICCPVFRPWRGAASMRGRRGACPCGAAALCTVQMRLPVPCHLAARRRKRFFWRPASDCALWQKQRLRAHAALAPAHVITHRRPTPIPIHPRRL